MRNLTRRGFIAGLLAAPAVAAVDVHFPISSSQIVMTQVSKPPYLLKTIVEWGDGAVFSMNLAPTDPALLQRVGAFISATAADLNA